MPLSSPCNKEPILELLKRQKAKTILDLGIGYGKFGPFFKLNIPGCRLFGIEIFKPYFDNIPKSCYERLYNEDMRTFDYERRFKRGAENCVDLDTITMIDSLEHLAKSDGVKLLEEIEKYPKHVIVSVPVVDIVQGSFLGNEWEEHKHQWKTHELEELGYTLHVKVGKLGVFYKDCM